MKDNFKRCFVSIMVLAIVMSSMPMLTNNVYASSSTILPEKDSLAGYLDDPTVFDIWGGNNFEGNPFYKVGNNPTSGAVYHGALKFNLPTHDMTNVRSIKLKLFIQEVMGDPIVCIYGSQNDIWGTSTGMVDPADATFPLVGTGDAIDKLALPGFSGNVSMSEVGYYKTFDITSIVKDNENIVISSGDTNLSLVIMSNEPYEDSRDDYFSFISAEGSNPPLLEIIEYSAPTVATAVTAPNIGITSATVNCEITDDGGKTVTDRGIEYKKKTDSAYTAAATTVSGTSFSAALSGLEPNTEYVTKAYATNEHGTTYSSEVTFKTLPPTADIAASEALEERNLDSSYIDITLNGTTFTDDVLLNENFTLNSAPTGLSVESVTFINSNQCRVNLAYNGNDFDSDIINSLGLTIAGSEIIYGTSITSQNNLSITAYNEAKVSSVTNPPNGRYKSGQTINFTVNYDKAVNITGSPYISLSLNTGSVVNAVYSSGSGSTSLVFTYTVPIDQAETNIKDIGSLITLNGGTIKDASNVSSELTLTGMASTTGILLDGKVPEASSLSPAHTSTNIDVNPNLILTFNENIDIGIGNIVIKKSIDDTVVETIAVTDISKVTKLNNTVTIDPTTTLSSETQYYILIDSTAITDLAGNSFAGIQGTATWSFTTKDIIPPSVSSFSPVDGATDVDKTSNLTLTFNENIVQDIAGQILLKTSEGITVDSDVTFATNTITINPKNDLIDLKSYYVLIDSNAIKDVDGNYFAGIGDTTTWNFTTKDSTPPTVISINRQTPAIESTNAASVIYRVTFSEAVSGVDISDFALTATGTVTGAIASVSAVSGTTIDVTVYIASGSGTLRLDLNSSGTGIADGAGNEINEGYTTGESYTIDKLAPTVSSITRQTPTTESTNATAVIYRVTFSEAVNGVDTADFALTGTATGVVASVSAASGTTIAVTVNNINGNGTLKLDLNSSGTGIADVVGNAISGGFSTGESYTVDRVAPAVSSITRQTPATESTNAATVIYKVTFSEAVSGVDTSDFALTGTATGVVASVSAASGTTIDVTVNNISGNGTLKLDLNSSGTGIIDETGNAISGGFSTGESYTVDRVAPTVSSITRQTPATESTNAATVIYKVTFSEAVNGVDTSDFMLNKTGTATGVVASVSADSGTTIDVTVNNISGTGTLRLDLNSSGTGIADETGNAISGGFSTGESYTVDRVAPTVSSITRQTPATESTNAATVIYKVTFSEAVSGVDTADFALTGTATGVVASVSAASGTTIAVTVNNISGTGTLRLDLNSTGTEIIDEIGNAISEGYTGGQIYTIDKAAPTISVSTEVAANNAYIDVTFGEAVRGASDGITLINTSDYAVNFQANGGTATGASITSITKITGAALDGSETTVRFKLSITGTSSGLETIEIKPADAASVYDIAGNSMLAEQTGGVKNLKNLTIPTPPPTPPTTPSTPTQDTIVNVIVNGKVENAATSVTTTVGDTTVTTITLDDKKIEQKLEAEGNNSTVIIPVNNNSDVVVGQLNGATVRNMQDKEAVLEIQTGNVTYTLPASEININDVLSQIGSQVELKDIKVNIQIAASSNATVSFVEDTSNKNGYQIVVEPVEFEITCTSGAKTVEVSRFNGYVERTIAIPDGIDPNKITTGIVLNSDGTFSHVPTKIIVIDGKYYAKINSLTNSAYSVIWNELTFKDMEGHWAKEAVNDLGSRLVINGVNKETFSPNKDITRAEFASIIVKALGIMRTGSGKEVFSDVNSDAWYFDAVSIAYERGIVKGYNGSFKPMDKITREEAMMMLKRAMEIAKLENNLSADAQNALLAKFTDKEHVSAWAKDSVAACLNSKIVVGTNNSILPRQNITRAETAIMIIRMLKTAELI